MRTVTGPDHYLGETAACHVCRGLKDCDECRCEWCEETSHELRDVDGEQMCPACVAKMDTCDVCGAPSRDLVSVTEDPGGRYQPPSYAWVCRACGAADN